MAKREIHFGHMIHNELQKQRRSVAWFAKEMRSDRSNMYKLLNRSHLDSDFILRASHKLSYDFFGEASAMFLREENSSDSAKETDE